MINFKKNSIFSRDAKEESVKEEILHGGVLAVWGSPGSGKTTTAVKLAKYLADKKKNVILKFQPKLSSKIYLLNSVINKGISEYHNSLPCFIHDIFLKKNRRILIKNFNKKNLKKILKNHENICNPHVLSRDVNKGYFHTWFKTHVLWF